MVHDDDTGDPVHLGFTDGDYPSYGNRSSSGISAEVRNLIISLAQEPGNGPHAIRKELKRLGCEVSLSTVKSVLADANLG